MFPKASTFFAVVSSIVLAFTAPGIAHAQTPTYGVQALAETSGFPGSYRDNPGTVAGAVSLSAASTPAGVEFNNGYGLVYAEGEALADAAPGQLYVKGRALADRITATAFTNANPTGVAESRFYDVLTVESATLPMGTEVTLIFRNEVQLVNFSTFGNHNGSVHTNLTLNGVGAYKSWYVSNTSQPGAFESPELTVKTKVGAQLRVDCKLRVQAVAQYFKSGIGYDGALTIEALARLVRLDGTPDITFRSDSGVVYPGLP